MFREVEVRPVTAPAAVAEGGEVTVIQSGWRLGLRSFAQNRLAVFGLAMIVFFVLFCYFGPFLYHGNTSVADVVNSNSPPVQGHPVGTDTEGFDVLGQMMVGGQASLEIGLLAAAIATRGGTL